MSARIRPGRGRPPVSATIAMLVSTGSSRARIRRWRGELRGGRRTAPFTAEGIADDDLAAVLRAYLKRWRWEVGMFFGGVGPKSTDAELPAGGRTSGILGILTLSLIHISEPTRR